MNTFISNQHRSEIKYNVHKHIETTERVRSALPFKFSIELYFFYLSWDWLLWLSMNPMQEDMTATLGAASSAAIS